MRRNDSTVTSRAEGHQANLDRNYLLFWRFNNLTISVFHCPITGGTLFFCAGGCKNEGDMNTWHWLTIGLVGIGLIPALWLLDRLGLWLEDRGWLYYRRKKPSSSAMSAWVAMQQFIEPGVNHVVQIGEENRSEDDEAARNEKVLANLLASLDATPVNCEEIRAYLAVAKRASLDWKKVYDEAVKLQRSARPDRADHIPQIEDVAPFA
jgi:hypothetical protein